MSDETCSVKVCVFCKKTEFRPDNCGMLHTMRVQPDATGGKSSLGRTLPVEVVSKVSRVEHSCCPNVDLIDQTVHGLYSGEARDESRGAHEYWCGATDTDERVLVLHEFEDRERN